MIRLPWLLFLGRSFLGGVWGPDSETNYCGSVGPANLRGVAGRIASRGGETPRAGRMDDGDVSAVKADG